MNSRERPIIFTGPMVCAIPEHRKTQTRRVIKPQPWLIDPNPSESGQWECGDGGGGSYLIRCPYGQPGDRLWLRETWRPYGWREDRPITVQFRDGSTREDNSVDESGYEDWYTRIAIQAAEECAEAGCYKDEEDCYTWAMPDECPTKWRPSIHMPRWVSRLTLKIIRIRVERLWEIGEDDAKAEGIPQEQSLNLVAAWAGMGLSDPRPASYRDGFANVWDRINAKRGFGWDMNPWVWVIDFRVVRK